MESSQQQYLSGGGPSILEQVQAHEQRQQQQPEGIGSKFTTFVQEVQLQTLGTLVQVAETARSMDVPERDIHEVVNRAYQGQGQQVQQRITQTTARLKNQLQQSGFGPASGQQGSGQSGSNW